MCVCVYMRARECNGARVNETGKVAGDGAEAGEWVKIAETRRAGEFRNRVFCSRGQRAKGEWNARGTRTKERVTARRAEEETYKGREQIARVTGEEEKRMGHLSHCLSEKERTNVAREDANSRKI